MVENEPGSAPFVGRPPAAPQTPRIPAAVKGVVTELVLGLVAHVLAEAARRLIEGRREGEQ
jgi:hypothetical protein